ncbi:MAG: RIP metalloprotease RseP [Candidatus Daviesbacteria bacterium]|nr:RIP metalloprotease RseP [Candidatus Daviesbacteria bacterium]
MILTIIIFIITLLFLVVSHEFGHFIVAKKFGIKVLEFGFGLPPKIFGKKWGETLVTLNWLPIGGFVKLLGEDETDKQSLRPNGLKKVLNDPRSFATKPVGQRIAVVVAGVIVNFILAVLIFWIVLASSGFSQQIPLLSPYKFFGVEQKNEIVVIIGNVSPNSPAEMAGIKNGDRILTINNISLNEASQLIEMTKKLAGEKISLTLSNEQNQQRKVEITPRANPPKGEGPLGVSLGAYEIANLSYVTFPQKLFSGITHTYNLASYSFVVLGKFIGTAISTQSLAPVSNTVAGPVGITNMANAILSVESPLVPYLNFVALLSLNLAVINILPFPALDGGRLFFLITEAVTRKKVKPEIERWIHTIGMIILLALIVLVTFSDIKKFF